MGGALPPWHGGIHPSLPRIPPYYMSKCRFGGDNTLSCTKKIFGKKLSFSLVFIEMNIEISDERLKTFLRRRFSSEDLNWIVNDVKEMIDEGESVDTAVYDGVREFIKSKKFSDIDEFGDDDSYWSSYLKYEKPLVVFVKSQLNLLKI